MIIGHKANRSKVVKSVLIGFELYMGTNAFTLAIIGIMGMVNQEIRNVIKTTGMIETDIIKTLMIVASLVYMIYNIFYYWIGKKQFEKGVNVD